MVCTRCPIREHRGTRIAAGRQNGPVRGESKFYVHGVLPHVSQLSNLSWHTNSAKNVLVTLPPFNSALTRMCTHAECGALIRAANRGGPRHLDLVHGFGLQVSQPVSASLPCKHLTR